MDVKALEKRLHSILVEIEGQHAALANCCSDGAQYVGQVREYLEVAGEHGVAYESMVATLEEGEFVLSGKAAVALLEVGLMLRYKTERDADKQFDLRTA